MDFTILPFSFWIYLNHRVFYSKIRNLKEYKPLNSSNDDDGFAVVFLKTNDDEVDRKDPTIGSVLSCLNSDDLE